MERIIPRWEWRTFGASFGEADRRFAALERGHVQESDEIYLLSRDTDANVKIRDRLMDIKTLEQVNAEGLEQWRPVMKGEFPLPAAEVARVCAALGVAPIAGLDAYTLERLQAELTQASRGVRVAQVHKRRQRYTVAGCTAEMTDVVADGRPFALGVMLAHVKLHRIGADIDHGVAGHTSYLTRSDRAAASARADS